jgi:serine/threonine-protein kinase HipA
MMTSDVLYVFKNNEDRTLVGKLSFSSGGVSFIYAPKFLLDAQSQPINPFQLPLITSGPAFKEKSLEGALTVFNDALPGKWGRCVLEGFYGKSLTDSEVLLEDQVDRVGDLVFSKNKSFPDIDQNSYAFNFEWNEILDAKDCIENHRTLTDKQKTWLKQGSGQGGARPKISLLKGDELYLVKLPSIHDYRLNVPQIEHGTLCLAKRCGIQTVETQIFKVGDSDILLVKRFDRDEQLHSIPYLSLASVCGIRSNQQGSYLQFALEMSRMGAVNDLPELFKRMVFNILVSNKDDHAFNHGLLFKDGRWLLSPAFDVVAGEGQSKVQSINVGDYNRESSLRNALSRCQDFRLSKIEAKKIIDDMVDIVKCEWKSVFLSNGVSQAMIDEIAWSMAHKDVFHGYEVSDLPSAIENYPH